MKAKLGSDRYLLGRAATPIVVSLLLLLLGTPFSSLGLLSAESTSGDSLGSQPHSPILIEGNAGFTAANGVTRGTGTASDPFIIESWEIDASTSDGITIRGTDAYFVVGNVLVHSGGGHRAIYFDIVSNGSVENSTISASFSWVTGSSNIVISGSNFTGSWLGIGSSSNILISDNTFSGGIYGSTSDIYVGDIAGLTISRNRLDGGRIGCDGGFISGTISGNDISNNGIGLDYCSGDLTIKENRFSNAIYRAIDISGEPSWLTLRIFHNDFLNAPVGDTGGDVGVSTTSWDDGYPSGGNFWSDYADGDECSGANQTLCTGPDGIGDMPRLIVCNGCHLQDSLDRYPLMNPYVTPQKPPATAQSVGSQVAVSGSNVYVVWTDNTLGNWDVFIRRSADRGSTFASRINLSNNPTASSHPKIAVCTNHVYVVWEDDGDVFMKRSVDGGATFKSRVNLSTNPGLSHSSQVACSGNHVYVVWLDDSSGEDRIFLKRSLDGGATFTSRITLNAPLADVETQGPLIALSGDNFYVTWSNFHSGKYEVFFRASNNGGASFGNIINVSNNTLHSLVSDITASGNNVYIVWSDGNFEDNADIFIIRSTDGGATFARRISLSFNLGYSFEARVAVSGGQVYVVWVDNASGANDVFIRRSTDGGASFHSRKNLSDNPGDSSDPRVALWGTRVYVSWRDNSGGNSDVFIRRSMDGAVTFKSRTNLSSNPSESSKLRIAVSGTVYALWQDNAPGNDDIFIRRSIYAGATPESRINLSRNLGASLLD